MTPPRSRSWGASLARRWSGCAAGPWAGCPWPGWPDTSGGKRSRTFHSIREYRGRKSEPKGIGWRDLRDLLVRAHFQLGGPIVLV